MISKQVLIHLSIVALFCASVVCSFELGRRSNERASTQSFIKGISTGLVRTIQVAATIRSDKNDVALKWSEQSIDFDLLSLDQFIKERPRDFDAFSLSAIKLASAYRSKYNKEYAESGVATFSSPEVAHALAYGSTNGTLIHTAFAEKYLGQP